MRGIYLPKPAGILLLCLLFLTGLTAQKSTANFKKAANQTIQLKETVTATPKVLAPGETCDEAIEIGPGTTTVDGITTGDGAVLTNAVHAKWYSYTPENDAIVTVTSCQITDTDTRVAIITGVDCNLANLAILTANDDCEPDIDNYASEVTFFAEAGVRYFVYWDDRWSGDGFDFELIEGATDIDVTFQVDMDEETVSGDGVNMVWAGLGADDISDVLVATMDDMDGDGIYTATVTLTSQDTIGYAFVNGMVDPLNVEAVPDDCGLENAFGFNIRPLILTSLEDLTLSPVCFGSCEPCSIVVEDCDEPFALIDDDFESYALDLLGPQSADWTTWSLNPGNAEDGLVTDEQAFSGAQSLKITDEDPDDVLLQLGDRSSGHYLLSWEMYIPADTSGYYNMQRFENDPGAEGAFQINFQADGTASVDVGEEAAFTFEYPQDSWFTVIHVINIEENILTLVVGNEIKYSWPFDWQTFEQGGGTAQIGSIDFFGNDGNTYYVDDVKFWVIPDAGTGQYCYTAEVIDAPGTFTSPGPDCFGAYYDRVFFNSGDVTGDAGYWYQYTPSADGVLTVSGCDGGADTRVWLLTGEDCLGAPLERVGVNDDRCDLGTGDEWASYLEAVVTGGQTYYILWDNVWDESGFDWELTLSEEPATPGDFCQSAVPVTAGEYVIEEITGEANVTGPVIGASGSGSTPTPYSQSTWYSYTATFEGQVEISSCLGAASDTRFWVYTGECGTFESLTLVGGNDDGGDDCGIDGLQSIDTLDVTPGTTYYIEWEDGWEDAAFSWSLTPLVPTAEVTFQVDMSLTMVDPGGVFIAGSFSSFGNVPMNDDDGDGIWTVALDLPESETFTYKFKNGPDGWENIDTSVGDDCTVGDFNDRFVDVGTDDMTLDVVCFGFCVDCQTVDVDEALLSQGLAVFPNPAKDQLQLRFDFDESVDNLNLRLVNTLGQLVEERYLGNVQRDHLTLDVSRLPAGVYLVQLASGQSRVTRTVVIE